MSRNVVVKRLALAAVLLGAFPAGASAHPHVFVSGSIEVVATPDGHLKHLRNVWWMDELFSSGVLVDFDKNGDGKLEPDELKAIGAQVAGSIVRWDFYTKLRKDGVPQAFDGPKSLDVAYDAKKGQLRFTLDLVPKKPLDLLHGSTEISNFDDTYFVAFDFKGAADVRLTGLPKRCKATMHQPNPDDAAKSWMATIAAIPADAEVPDDGIKFSEALATTFAVTCGG